MAEPSTTSADSDPHCLVLSTIPGLHSHPRKLLFKDLGAVETWLRARPSTKARVFVLTELDVDVLMA